VIDVQFDDAVEHLPKAWIKGNRLVQYHTEWSRLRFEVEQDKQPWPREDDESSISCLRVFEWWLRRATIMPHLFELVEKLCVVPTSSAAVERGFSILKLKLAPTQYATLDDLTSLRVELGFQVRSGLIDPDEEVVEQEEGKHEDDDDDEDFGEPFYSITDSLTDQDTIRSNFSKRTQPLSTVRSWSKCARLCHKWQRHKRSMDQIFSVLIPL
jgi:hypothetical protein